MRIARSHIGKTKVEGLSYDPEDCNCESFAVYCKTGRLASPQVEAIHSALETVDKKLENLNEKAGDGVAGGVVALASATVLFPSAVVGVVVGQALRNSMRVADNFMDSFDETLEKWDLEIHSAAREVGNEFGDFLEETGDKIDEICDSVKKTWKEFFD